MSPRSIPALTVVALVLLGGCLNGAPIGDTPSSDGGPEPAPAGLPHHGQIVVDEADDPPADAVHYTNETIQSTEPLQTALERYRHGENGTVVTVDDDRYNATIAALQSLIDRSAPTRTDQPGPNTYVELEDDIVYVGVTANGSISGRVVPSTPSD
ncbi:hypothetical protein [Halovivax limisalsi]|uniref:hypothetical protein n=1 Tax=Halovivax limisalsi TaxID=1453760 RepID=UPI001FFDD04F|nr:hypothetical protein [Halovivax limisalsi]